MGKSVEIGDFLRTLRSVQDRKVRFLAEAGGLPPDASDQVPSEPIADPNQLEPVSQEATAEMQEGTVTLEMVIGKFNTIRSGRSFKDKEIQSQLMAYFEKLADDQKVAMYAFLKGVAQIVSGEFTGYNPVGPADIPQGGDSNSPPPGPAPESTPQAPAAPSAPAQASTAPAPPVSSAPPPPAAPHKRVIKTVKPNIIKRKLPPSNAAGNPSPVPITPKVRR